MKKLFEATQIRNVCLGALVAASAALVACGNDDDELVRDVPGGDPAEGRAAMERYGCGSCHAIPGVDGADATLAPPLTAFAEREFIAGVIPNTAENLIRWIQDPQSVNPDTAMPDVGASEEEARHMAAHLYTLD